MTTIRADVVTQAREFHAAIIAADDDALKELAQAWKATRTDLIQQERDFLARLVDKYGYPLKLTPNQLYRVERLDSLIAQVEAQVDFFAAGAKGGVEESQRLAFEMAMDHADEYAKQFGWEGMQRVTPITNAAHLEAAVGRERTDAVRTLFDQFGKATGDKIRDTIIVGVGSGTHPLTIARKLVKATDMPGWRAANISRTEMMGAYRQGSINAYQTNPTVAGWVWLTAGDGRVCPVCRAMSGTSHATSEPFATHPSCRCVPKPQTMSWGDLMGSDFADIPESVDAVPDGEESFAALSAFEQKRVLGPGRYELYDSGTPLRDMIRTTSDPVWGPGRELIPLYDM